VPVIVSGDAQPGSGDVAALAFRNAAAAEQLTDGQVQRAVVALVSLLNDCRALLGEDHPETLVVEGNLAVAYVMAGQEEDGAHLMLANLAGRERVFGDEHTATLTARDALATTHRLAGRLSEALWLYSRVAPQRNRVLGPSHPDTLTTRLGLGLTFAEAGDTAMALDVVTAAVHDCDQAGIGGQHAEMLRSCLTDLRRAGTVPDPAAVPGPAAVPRRRSGLAAATVRAPAAPQLDRDERQPIDIGSGTERGGGT